MKGARVRMLARELAHFRHRPLEECFVSAEAIFCDLMEMLTQFDSYAYGEPLEGQIGAGKIGGEFSFPSVQSLDDVASEEDMHEARVIALAYEMALDEGKGSELGQQVEMLFPYIGRARALLRPKEIGLVIPRQVADPYFM